MIISVDNQGLLRFLNAQERGDPASLETALKELRAGRKKEHWIWYVFPQLRGLGSSHHSQFYGIEGLSEAIDYLLNPLLRERYQLCLSELLFSLRKGIELQSILGGADTLKAISSITLFQLAAKSPVLQNEQLASELLLLMDEMFVFVARDGRNPCRATLHGLE